MVSVSEITKRYGATVALDDLTFTVPEGAVFGLLGPNASGKSTLIKLMMGYIFPDRGRIDLGALKRRDIGYVPERPHFPSRSPLRAYMRVAGRLGGLSGAALARAVDERLTQVGLAPAARAPISACSKGMLQRLALAQALLNDPPFLLLDEPMGGLDPAWQKEVRELVKTLAKEGRTVVFSTHRLSEVADVCTHVGILNHGKLVRAGGLDEALPLRNRVTITVDSLTQDTRARIAGLNASIAIDGNQIVLSGDAVECKRDVVQVLLQAGADIRHLAHERATLEEIYLEAMRR